MTKRLIAAAFIAVLGFAVAAPAQARDTNWPCPGCAVAHR